jgi:hypothetical protein
MAPPTLRCIRCIVSHSPAMSSRRMFASTPINAVLRCQDPFPMQTPEIDQKGRPRYQQTTYDKHDSAGRRPKKNFDGWGASSSRFGTERGEGSRHFEKSGGFEGRGGSRPFGKKGGYGMKSSSDTTRDEISGRSARADYGGGRDQYTPERTREERPRFDRERERGTGSRAPFAPQNSPRDVKRGNWPESRSIYGQDRFGGEKGSWSKRPGNNEDAYPRAFANTKIGDRVRNDGERSSRSYQSRDGTSHKDTTSDTPARPWEPSKKLTFQAMAGLRALHTNDPEKFDRDALSERFGISYDAVTRILRSDYRDRKGAESGEKIQGTKWDMNPGTSRLSPVPAIKRAFGVGGRDGGSGSQGR